MRIVAAFAAVLAFAACSGSIVVPPSRETGASSLMKASLDRLYAADAGGFSPSSPVYYYNAVGMHQAPLGHFGHFHSPYAIATDLAGNIYVPDDGSGAYDGRVYVFANVTSKPFLTLDDKGGLPADLAVAADGTVYVANGYDQQSCGGGGDVRVFKKGMSSASYIVCDSGIAQGYSQVNGVAIDAAGDVFVTWESSTNTFGRVREFTPGPNYKGHYLPPSFKNPYAIAVDPSGNVIVSDVRVPAVEVFAPGSKTPKYTFAQTGDPTRIAFDAAAGHIFVADALANQIDEYMYP